MFSIDGRVIALGPGAGDVAGLTILAVDTLEGTPAVAITAITTTEGTFSLTLELGDLIHLFRGDPRSEPRVLERVASLHLSILRNGTTLALHDVSFTLVDLLDPTHRVELSVPAGGDTPGRGDRGRDACRYFVRGNLRQTDGTPVPSALVEVVEQRLRTEAMLGEARTSDAGAYEVAYGSPAPCNPARPGKNLFARAFGAQGEELALSRLHCDVPADVRIDLVVGEAGAVVRGPSRYVQVRDVVTPRLEGVELHELTADDVEHLACVTQQDVVHVAYLARSAQLEVETGVTSVAFFAFANAGLPTKLVGVLGQDRETLAAALTRGEADNVVPPWREGQVESILDAFHEALLERSVPRADPAASLLGELLLTGGVARSLPREFIEAYVAREGTVQEFWEGFRTERGASTIDTVQFTLAIGSLTGNHIPLVESLQSRRAAHEIERARDLARLTVTDWLDVLTSGPRPPGAPAAIPGETQAEKNEKYAATLQRVFEDAFPTMAVAGALARAGILHGVDEFVSLNPAFDLGATRIDAFLEGNPNLPSADPEELRRDLKHVQRLHAIAPRLGRGAAVTALLRQNIISAQHVYKLGYASFTHRFEGVMSDAERELVWRKATQQAHKVLAVAARYGSPSNVPAMPVIAAHIPEPDDGFPDISSLFGAQDFCACEHCRGVFSPAAYLTDLLSFLRDQPAAQDGSFADGTLLDVIEARREDLVHVLLNCDNAHVPLPTIDLVNELLERRVSPPQPSDWADLQTTWTADELRAHPEHVHQPAYDTLEEALHPFILPFDLRLEEARLYLDHLGVRLADLLDVLKGHSEASTDIQALARETLRLSRMQGEIVENDFSDTPQPQALWGLGASWASDLNGDVRLFLKQTSLTYEELLELLYVDYVCMPAGTVEIEHAEGKPCTLEDASFDDWNGGGTSAETRLGRAQRFIRLARRMGWSFFDLDAAVRALSTVEDPLEDDAVDGAWLRRFAGVVRLLERWPQLAKLELLSWFGTLDTRSGRHGEPSFYARLFLDRTLDPDNEDFGLDAESAELENTDALDPSTDGPVLQAVLNLRDGELEALLEALDAFVGATPQRDLSWLSRLYRRASLSRALGMSMSELLRVASLLGEEPFADGAAPQPDVAHTRAFLERVDRVNATRFTLAELDYLLRHRFDASEGVALLRDRQQEIFVELIRGLQDIEADTSRGTDEATPALTALGDRLGEVIAEAFIQTTLLLIETADIEGANEPALRAELEQFLSTDEVDTLFEEPESAADPRTAAQRAEDTLVTLLEHVRRTQMAAVVVQKLSEAVGIETGAGVALLRQIEVNGDDGVTLFSQDAFVHAIDFEADAEAIKTAGFPELTPANVLDDHFETLERLHKAALVVRRFGLNVRNLEWLLERAESLDLLSPLDLPTGEPVDGPAPQWARWEKLARVVLLRDAVFRDPDALFDLLATADDENSHLNEESQALLVEGTGWDADDLRHLVEHTEESLDIDAASIVAVDGLERLARAFRMLRRLGVSADRATAWATTDVTPELARAIKSATRSKHAPQQWPAVIGPLRDALREQQRDALVAQVLAQSSELREPDDLLGELLIDVQGAACQRTSRIVQASAAVQLFVQRMLMDLEQPERLDDRAAREWVWRKFYRVWEANRKVFLYPENFVEPELRDDQSPLFRGLTADLMDADLTPERAERAYVSFLRKIKEVARLEAAGIYHQVEYGQYADPNLGGLQTLNILHVFARTMSPPYRYFYRRWVNETYWTAWEEIPLGIEHPTVMPALHHRRLLLMWPMFTEAAVKPTGGSDNARPYVEIQLAFSEYVDGAWTQSRLSEETTPALRLRSEFIGTLTSGPEMGLQLGLLDDEATRFPAGIFFETLVDEHKLVVQPMFFAEARLVPVGGLADPAAIAQLGVFLTTPHAFHFIGSENKVIRVDAEAEVRPGDWPSAHPRPNLSGIRHQYFNLSRQSFDANEHPATREFRLFRPGFFNDVVMTPRLVRAASPYEVLAPRHNTHGNAVRFLAEDPFFYHDDRRAFFVWPRDPNEIGLPSFEGDESDLSDLNSHNIGLYVREPGNPTFAGLGTASGGILDDPPDQGADDDYLASQARSKRFWFFSFQHPFITRMLEIVEREGVEGLLNPAEAGDNADLRRQLKSELVMRQVPGEYEPNHDMVKVLARDEFEFEAWGAYALYNWEMFFHAPLLVARRLTDAQRFEDAQRWYHYVFDPTDSSADDVAQRFWKVKPLYEASRPASISEQLEALNYTGGDPDKRLLRHTTEAQIAQWRDNPFNPHLLARMRPAAYQRATVMKYLDNLIAWGDHLFRQATRETIAEALQIYVLARQILGPRPVRLEARTPEDRSFDQLEDDLDAFSNALVELENLVPPGNQWAWLQLDSKLLTPQISDGVVQPGGGLRLNFAFPPPPDPPLNILATPSHGGLQPEVMLLNLAFTIAVDEPEPERALYFCVPPNDKLLSYWDTVEDRLFKIRNCLDIEGIRLELPLFQPPIDPALLVKAAAAGIDLASAIAALNAPRPHYRFRTMIPVAKELAAEVRTLGQALLSALERKDAEALAELRATHEVRTVEAAERVLEERVSEARQNITALEAANAVAEHRKGFYEALINEGRLEAETEGLDKLDDSVAKHEGVIDTEDLLARLAFAPDLSLGGAVGWSGGMGGGLHGTFSFSSAFGGSHFANSHSARARRQSAKAAIAGVVSSKSLSEAGLQRQRQPWQLEREQAEKEIERIGQEITAAEIRQEIALKELDNHRREIAQARERESFLRQRFTRSELYGWMASEVGRVYHQAYQLAYDVAKRAERTYQLELAATDTSFIQFGYWDNQRKGLLAGDKLLHDIRRMETAYLQNHRREFELTKSVSLATLDPMALVLLKETGECYLSVPEMLFDLDHPGHFLRRLKAVSVSVPAKTGQLAEVPLTLTLASSAIRTSTALSGAAPDPEALVADLTSGIQQLATLSAEEDDGLFERNFNDERYLPFEGRGAVSLWHIELPRNFRPFDYALISDVVVRLSFTARQGGDAFKAAVTGEIEAAIDAYVRHESSFGEGLMNAVSVARSFPDDWSRFVDPPGDEVPQLELDMSADRFPWKFQGGEIRVGTLWLLAVFRDAESTQTLAFDLELPESTTISNLELSGDFPGSARIRMQSDAPSTQPTTGAWTLELVGGPTEVPDSLEDLVLVMQYRVE